MSAPSKVDVQKAVRQVRDRLRQLEACLDDRAAAAKAGGELCYDALVVSKLVTARNEPPPPEPGNVPEPEAPADPTGVDCPERYEGAVRPGGNNWTE